MFYRNNRPQRGTMPHKRMLITALLTLALAFFLLPSHTSAQTVRIPADGPKINNLTVGFDGNYRDGNWVPIRVTLSNTGANFSGKLSVNLPAPFGGNSFNAAISSSTYQAEVTLPPVSQKQVTIYVPLSQGTQGGTQTVTVDLLDSNGQKVQSASKNLTSLSNTYIFVGILSNHASIPNGLSNALQNQGANVQTVSLTAATIPSNPEVLKNFDMLVIDNFTSSSLSKDQITTLQSWVNQGGTLVVSGGPEYQRTLSPLPTDLLPVTLTGTDTVPAGSHMLILGGPSKGGPGDEQNNDTISAPVSVSAATPRAGNTVLLSSGTTPLVVQANVGQGTVYYLAFDPAIEPVANWQYNSSFWGSLIIRTLGDQILPINSSMGIPKFNPTSSLVGFLSQLIPNTYPSIWLILALLLSYILVLGPLRLLLVRWLKRRDWSWRIVLSTIVIFSLLSYGLALQEKGTSIINSSVSITQLGRPDTAGTIAHITNYMGVFVPSQGDFHVHVPNAILVQPSDDNQGAYGYRPGGQSATQRTTVTSVTNGVDVDLQGVDNWSLRTLVSTHDIHTQGGIISHLALQNDTLTGTVTNTLPYPLTDVYVLMGNDYLFLGDLPASKSKQVSLQLSSSLNMTPSTNQQYSLADQIASSRGMSNTQYNGPYPNTSQNQDEPHRHITMLETLSGEYYCGGGGPCFRNPAPFGPASTVAKRTPGAARMNNQDPLLIDGTSATLIGWTPTLADAASKMTINGNAFSGAQENLVQAPLDVTFSGPVQLPSSVITSQVVNVQQDPTSTGNIQEPLAGVYSMTTGAMTFEFTLPALPKIQSNHITITEASNPTRGFGFGSGSGTTTDANHLRAALYNWQTGKWDTFAVSGLQITIDGAQSQAYIGPGGRILLQFANQDTTLGTVIFNKPALELHGTVSS